MFGVMLPNLSSTDKIITLKKLDKRVTSTINFISALFKPKFLQSHAKSQRVSGMPAFVSNANFYVWGEKK